MAVEGIEKYRQLNGNDILKVILKPTKNFPDGYFYCDANDEELVRSYTWFLNSQKHPYVIAVIRSHDNQQTLYFHQEKAFNEKGYYPKCINHINMVEFDNVDRNLDPVTSQQNNWYKVSKGYLKDKRCRSFVPRIKVDSYNIYAKSVKIEVEAIQSAYLLEMQYEDYRYDFLEDRRKDADILDLERTGQISEEEAVYRHVLRYADNAWYYYRYNLADYFRYYHIPIPKYSLDSLGYMTHHITGQRLCPL